MAAGPVALRALSAAVDSSTCFLISTLLLRELSRNQVSKKTLGRRKAHEHANHNGQVFLFPSSAAKIAVSEQITLDNARDMAAKWVSCKSAKRAVSTPLRQPDSAFTVATPHW